MTSKRLSARVVAASVAAFAIGAMPAACGRDDALVGGQCAAGYTPCGSSCCALVYGSPDATAMDATADAYDAVADARPDAMDASPDVVDGQTLDGQLDAPADSPSDPPPTDATGDAKGDGPSADAPTDSPVSDAPIDAEPETGPLCMAPLVDCGGVCVDTTSDPSNCKQCGVVCPSQLCVNSTCVGMAAGGIVFIGHDYLTTPTGTAQARVLSNSASIGGSMPRVLSYERYANANAVARVKAILASATITSTTTDSDIPNDLTIQNYGVLLVEDQATAASGVLATLGSSWASTVGSFTQQGGIVIVLDGGTGVGEMPEFATATGLLEVSSQTSIVSGTPLDVVAPGDAVGVGVISPYAAGTHSVTITLGTEAGSAVDVVDLPIDGGTFTPVVVHRAL